MTEALLWVATMIFTYCVILLPVERRVRRCQVPSPVDQRRCHLRRRHVVHEAKMKGGGLVSWNDVPDAHLSATVRNGKEIKDPPDDLRVPIAEVVKWAERKVIAEHFPLDGDPHKAEVVANRSQFSGPPVVLPGSPADPFIPGVPVSGGGGPPVVLPPGATYTPFGPASITTNSAGGAVTAAYHRPLLDRLRERRIEIWSEAWLLASKRQGGEFSRAECATWKELQSELDRLDAHIKALVAVLGERQGRLGRQIKAFEERP